MVIQDIRIHRSELGLTRPYTIAYRTVSHTEVVWAEVIASDGTVGVGAANPSPLVTGETLDDTERTLREIAPQLIGVSPYALRANCEKLMLLTALPAARAVLDIALHDLLGKLVSMSVVDLFGKRHDHMLTSITIGIKGVEETLEEAKEYHQMGFRSLKVKLGHYIEEDIERLAKLREHFGSGILIRVDANQGYSRAELGLFLAQTEAFHLELIEQPIKYDDVEGLRELDQQHKALIAADEALKTYDHALRLITPTNACGIFNIKLMKSGGIYPALQIADLAQAAGIGLMWGCNDESIVSITAALHAAFACPHTAFLDLDGSLDMATDIVRGGFVLEDGMMRVGEGSGLGVELI